jgi:gamma-butyrobetaine dioxygenase/trimethyllysine dioxygenase
MVSTQENVALSRGWLRIQLANGPADFHYRWLRHACDLDRHPLTNERIVCSSELPDTLEVKRAFVSGDRLHVVWTHDGRESRYALAWLQQHAYASGRTYPPTLPTSLSEVEVVSADIDSAIHQASERLRSHGVAIVRGSTREAPEQLTEPLIAAWEKWGFEVVGTHFGRIEDLRTDNTTNQNTDQLGYTDAAVELHTDQPFLEAPPRYQLLQNLQVADSGGENAIVDGLAAAELLQQEDQYAYEILRDTPVIFHRRQKNFESIVKSPIFQGHGQDFLIRYSYFTLAPHRVPFSRMDGFYRAYDRFARLVRNPANQRRFLLREGDYLIYDNHRMLHARTSFTGARWMRGVYFNPKVGN